MRLTYYVSLLNTILFLTGIQHFKSKLLKLISGTRIKNIAREFRKKKRLNLKNLSNIKENGNKLQLITVKSEKKQKRNKKNK